MFMIYNDNGVEGVVYYIVWFLLINCNINFLIGIVNNERVCIWSMYGFSGFGEF